ncbi:MAG: hypothetical protein ACFBRM_01130 [Pikeienuella sp.]
MDAVPARLHAILARDAPIGAVFRRGPSGHVATCHWDLTTDRITLGQWLKGRIYPARGDISPDGRHVIYFAMNGRWASESTGAWTAIARTGWLKARVLIKEGDCWGGGGLFLDNRRYWVGSALPRKEQILKDCADLQPVADLALDPQLAADRPSVRELRLRGRGWMPLGTPPRRFWSYERGLPHGWVLRKRHAAQHRHGERGVTEETEEHDLVAPDSTVLERPGWEWADRDGGDVVYAEGGCLWRLSIDGRDRLGAPRLIHDFTPMVFEALAAPD